MATMMPSRIAPISTQESLDSESMTQALRPWHRRLCLRQVLHWTAGGIAAGLILACLVLIIARLLPWAQAPSIAIGLGAVCVVLAFAASIWLRPSIASTAHIVDERLALYDRLSTAWEMRDQVSVLTSLQRRDALKQLEKHQPNTTISFSFKRSGVLVLTGALLVLALLIALPNPMNAILKQRAAFQGQIAQQVKSIDKARQILNQQTSTSAAQKQQIDQILRDLETRLQQAKNETDAQQAIADAQAKLNQLRDPQAANRIQGQAAAGTALQNSSNQNLRSAGQALSNNDSKSLAQALQNLTSQASKMTPDQRAKLSQQLEQAANQASQNPNLSSALHQLAKATADNSQSEMNDASKAVTTAANQGAADQTENNTLNQATQNLQQSANALASNTDTTATRVQNGQSQGQSGQTGQGSQGNQGAQGTPTGQEQGQGTQGNQAQGQGQGQGTQGNQAQGQGQGQGQGLGQGQGGQGKGGQGGSNGSGGQQGKNEQVFVPGQVGAGASTQSNDNNNNSAVQQGSSVPYNQVIQQYNQAAHDAIDNSNTPPDVKDLVHNYFDTLEGQH